MTAYMLWLQDVRSKIKADNPGISVTDVSKKAGAMWKTVATIEKKVNMAVGTGIVSILLLLCS